VTATAVVLSLAPSATAPPLFIAAQTLSATEGKLVLWRSDLDFKRAPSVGSVHLENNGQRLVVRLDPGLANAGGLPNSRNSSGDLPAWRSPMTRPDRVGQGRSRRSRPSIRSPDGAPLAGIRRAARAA
jgi:hypothetical protein